MVALWSLRILALGFLLGALLLIVGSVLWAVGFIGDQGSNDPPNPMVTASMGARG
jgi:hypothetical protein